MILTVCVTIPWDRLAASIAIVMTVTMGRIVTTRLIRVSTNTVVGTVIAELCLIYVVMYPLCVPAMIAMVGLEM